MALDDVSFLKLEVERLKQEVEFLHSSLNDFKSFNSKLDLVLKQLKDLDSKFVKK